MTTTDGTVKFNIVDARAAAIFDLIYPIGSVFATTGSAPARGTWEEIAKGRTLQGADSVHAAGTTIAAGLPNITGWFRNRKMDSDTTTMVLDGSLFTETGDKGSDYVQLQRASATGTTREITFDASKSNAIYGKSSTVQPPAYVVHFYRRIA